MGYAAGFFLACFSLLAAGVAGGESSSHDRRIFLIFLESFWKGSTSTVGYGTGFSPSTHLGNIAGMIEALDYIQAQGFTAVWHTPIFDSEGFAPDADGQVDARLDSCGYYARDYFAVDPHFGNCRNNPVASLMTLR